jgi:hypothetical protein
VETNTWSPLPSMKNNRGRFDITCVNNDVVYAVAGSNGQAEICSVEKYDAKIGKWSKSASLPVNLSNIGKANGRGSIRSRFPIATLSPPFLCRPVVTLSSRMCA